MLHVPSAESVDNAGESYLIYILKLIYNQKPTKLSTVSTMHADPKAARQSHIRYRSRLWEPPPPVLFITPANRSERLHG